MNKGVNRIFEKVKELIEISEAGVACSEYLTLPHTFQADPSHSEWNGRN